MSNQKYFSFDEFLENVGGKEFTIIRTERDSEKTKFLADLCDKLQEECKELKNKNRILRKSLNTFYGKFGNYQDTDSILHSKFERIIYNSIHEENLKLTERVDELKQQNYILNDNVFIQKMIIENLNSKLSQIQEIAK